MSYVLDCRSASQAESLHSELACPTASKTSPNQAAKDTSLHGVQFSTEHVCGCMLANRSGFAGNVDISMPRRRHAGLWPGRLITRVHEGAQTARDTQRHVTHMSSASRGSRLGLHISGGLHSWGAASLTLLDGLGFRVQNET